MIHYMKGNLLEADVEALVNTVNTVGVMGKGIALMFKERFPKNLEIYTKACKAKQLQTGKILVTATDELLGPQWVVNFPTKQHWRNPSKMEWIVEGLTDLKQFIVKHQIKSIAIPPLGAGNGGLDWSEVRICIEQALSDLNGVDVLIYEPTNQYQNISKHMVLKALTPARALITELVRRYGILGFECSLLEVQKLAWFLERVIENEPIKNPLQLKFVAHKYGPYADRLRHVLTSLSGSYLISKKHISDSNPLDVVWFNDSQKDHVNTYLHTEAKDYLSALEKTTRIVDGFETPPGLELLATVDWLIYKEKAAPTVEGILDSIKRWPAGEKWAQRKARLFDERAISIALTHLQNMGMQYV